jgi:ribonuclease BN (tRNA processing enzyme)
MEVITSKKMVSIINCSLFLVCLAILAVIAGGAFAQQQRPTEYKHENDLSVITVGSGVPGALGDRAEAMTVIQYKGRYIVIDCGYTSVLKLMKSGMPMRNIDIIMFSHLHADHSTDFFNLMTRRFLSGGRELEIIGPPRTGKYYEFYRWFYRDDIIYRAQLSNIKTSAGSLTGVKVREVIGSQKIDTKRILIESAEMAHTMYDLAYKFTIDGKTIVVSGDTSYNENLINLAKNVDLFVLDGSFIIYALRPPVQNPPEREDLGKRKIGGKIPEPTDAYSGRFSVESHSNYRDIIRIVSETRPKKLILTHLFSGYMGRPDPHTKELRDKVRSDLKKAGFYGELHFAKDGLEVGI